MMNDFNNNNNEFQNNKINEVSYYPTDDMYNDASASRNLRTISQVRRF